jgi:hypothetical protein
VRIVEEPAIVRVQILLDDGECFTYRGPVLAQVINPPVREGYIDRVIGEWTSKGEKTYTLAGWSLRADGTPGKRQLHWLCDYTDIPAFVRRLLVNTRFQRCQELLAAHPGRFPKAVSA